MIDKEGQELLATLFNTMTFEQKKSIPDATASRIVDFMVKNGYRYVFDRWYLQAAPVDETARQQKE